MFINLNLVIFKNLLPVIADKKLFMRVQWDFSPTKPNIVSQVSRAHSLQFVCFDSSLAKQVAAPLRSKVSADLMRLFSEKQGTTAGAALDMQLPHASSKLLPFKELLTALIQVSSSGDRF